MRMSNILFQAYTIFFIHASVDGKVIYYHILVIRNNAAMNMAVGNIEHFSSEESLPPLPQEMKILPVI